jgi:16S rRNA (guanine966-N2)-methyltransferase
VTRIIAGTAGGRRLATPSGAATRPTSDRVREALFAALDARDAVAGARVLDLYSGSGALGLEAISRGAVAAVLVDSARAAAETARRNVATLRLAAARVVAAPVLRYLSGTAEQFDLVLLDPPYDTAEDDLAAVLAALAPAWLAPHAVVVVERGRRSPEPGWPPSLRGEPARQYGETVLWLAGHERIR